jgi:hypothetical protein
VSSRTPNHYTSEFKSFDEFEQQIQRTGQCPFVYRGQGTSALPKPRFLRESNAKKNANELEERFIQHFQKDLGRSFPNNAFAKWRILTWLQHYGAPTRLLDWTQDPLVAVWFAIAARLSQIEEGQSGASTVATVWTVTVSEEDWLDVKDHIECVDPMTVSNSKFVRSPEIDARVVAQCSIFSAHRLPQSNLDCVNGLWPDWEPKLTSGEMRAYFCRDEILPNLFTALKKKGITRRSIYPDLNRVAAELNGRYLGAPNMYLIRSGIRMPWREEG